MLKSLLRFLGIIAPTKPSKPRKRVDAGDSVYISSQVNPALVPSPKVQGIEIMRELFRITSRDVARDHGIPPEWLGCEVLTISKQQKTTFQVKITINHWDDQLMLFARAFELAYVARLAQVSADAAQAFRSMVWCVSETAGCPYDKMPEGEFWSEAARNERETLQRFRDVDRLMALTKSDAFSTSNQATEPMPLDDKRPLIANHIIIS
ncbi:MAG: hypothetical protein ACKVOO_01895 [Burkholderiaceae bacterium]